MKGSLLSDLERLIVLQLKNRFLWMLIGISALLILQLTMLKINGEKGLSPYGPGLSTFDLLATLMFIIEGATVGVMLLTLLAEPALKEAWEKRWPDRPFNRLAAGLSSTPTQFIAALALLIPMIYLHRYPELSAAQGISIRIAKGLNAIMGSRGSVFAGRYFNRVLTTTRQVRTLLAYMLNNARHHELVENVADDWVDEFSSAHAFDGWTKPVRTNAQAPPPVVEGESWLMKRWRDSGGSIAPDFVPGRGDVVDHPAAA